MVLPDRVDPEGEILQGVKRISNCQVRKLQEAGHTTFGAGGWSVAGEKSREHTKTNRYFEQDGGEMLVPFISI